VAKSKTSTKKTKPKAGRITSLHVIDPRMLVRIRRAAKLHGESVSRFMLRVADVEAVKVLEGNCPSCGSPMARVEKKRKQDKAA
jgi:rRNA maturation endonuclease Nob1